MFNYFMAFLTSGFITWFAIPSIIKVAEIKHLFDMPDERKCHKLNVPTLGGMAIFAGMLFSVTFWADQIQIAELQYIICSLIILFFVGMKDDLFNLVHYKKLLGQLFASFILVHFAGIKVTSFFGIFGISDLDILTSYTFSIFTMVVITNAMNLIDGIDCLAGSVGALASLIFGMWFFSVNQAQYVVLSAALLGSLIGFLYYNRTPARIFMGDTGSLIIGIVLSILAIKFIEMNRVMPIDAPNKIRGVPVFTIAVLIIPLFDTLRIFGIRILQGRSPFHPDRNHIHHLLIDLGLTHIQATLVLIGFNLLMIGFAFKMQTIRSEITLSLILLSCLTSTYFLAFTRNKRNRLKIINVTPSSVIKKTHEK